METTAKLGKFKLGKAKLGYITKERGVASLGKFKLGKAGLGIKTKKKEIKFNKRRVPCILGSGRIGTATNPRDIDFEGIYYVRNKRTKFLKSGEKETGRKHMVKRRLYMSSNLQHPNVLDENEDMRQGAIAWSNLTTNQKIEYNDKAKKQGIWSGYNLFQKEWLKTH